MKQLFSYLKTNDNIFKDDKNYIYNFYNKMNYINQIYDMHPELPKSYGNYNAKIVFIFESEEQKKILIPFLTEFLNKNNISIWNIYVTINKDQTFLSNELNAIAPKIVYKFYKENKDVIACSKFQKLQLIKFYYLQENNLLAKQDDCLNDLMIMNFYKELEIKE